MTQIRAKDRIGESDYPIVKVMAAPVGENPDEGLVSETNPMPVALGVLNFDIGVKMLDTLRALVEQQRLTNLYLSCMTGEDFSTTDIKRDDL